jgi:hypothetical protein
MKKPIHNKAKGVLLLLSLICSVQITTAQFVELTAQVDVNEWSAHSMVEPYKLHLVVGTNSWRMDGDLCGNCDMTYWFTGDMIIEHSKVTKMPVGVELSPEEIKEMKRFIGSESTRAYESPDGNPSFSWTARVADRLGLTARIGWLAFCSGPYLQREGRAIFPPNDLWKETVPTAAFSDVTVRFNDAFGLPKLLELYMTNCPNVQPVLQYRVMSSTNIMGWEFPLEFKMAQYSAAPLPGIPGIIAGTNGWELNFVARGRVTAIGPGTKPQVPEAVLKAAGK